MRRRPDPVLLELFEQAGRNVQRTSLMLRDMLAGFPDSAGLARGIYVCEQEGTESLESAVDACETVANVLEGISLKR